MQTGKCFWWIECKLLFCFSISVARFLKIEINENYEIQIKTPRSGLTITRCGRKLRNFRQKWILLTQFRFIQTWFSWSSWCLWEIHKQTKQSKSKKSKFIALWCSDIRNCFILLDNFYIPYFLVMFLWKVKKISLSTYEMYDWGNGVWVIIFGRNFFEAEVW